MDDHDVKTLLETVAKQQNELIQHLAQQNVKSRRKDIWDQLTAVAPILSAILIATIGAYFTYTYNQQQLKLQEMQTIERFIPHLTGTEKSKRLAILAISSLANAQLAAKVASIFASEGTVSALQSIAESGNMKDRSIASNALAQTLENMSKDYQEDNQYEKAVAASLKSLAIKEASLGPDHDEVLDHMAKLADMYLSHGDKRMAEEMLIKVLNAKKRLSGLDSAETVVALRSLANFYDRQGNASKAALYFKQAQLSEKKANNMVDTKAELSTNAPAKDNGSAENAEAHEISEDNSASNKTNNAESAANSENQAKKQNAQISASNTEVAQ